MSASETSREHLRVLLPLRFVLLLTFFSIQTATIPAKYSARIAQAFSSSKPSISLHPTQILQIDDITSQSGSCHSDGVGLISAALATDVVKALKLDVSPTPTCFQFRLGGSKGRVSFFLTFFLSDSARSP
jgi:hypothetical protein